ncbi:MAG: hypothetical protein ACYS3S_10730 [Planctomycetota bacterium]|jgi:hypothetical protein
MKDLRRLAVLGLELAGGPISLVVLRSFTRTEAAVYAHRPSNGNIAGQLTIAGNRQANYAD